MPILYSDSCFLEHETGNHPESALRLRSIVDRLEKTELQKQFEQGVVQPATREQLERVHSSSYISSVARFARQGGGIIESNTVMCPRSFDVALRAAGVAVSAVDDVIGGPHFRAVCLIRPPGHHALQNSAMGFCLFNNVAVAAKHARAVYGLSRILIVDWDVHHGNGTQDMFYDDAETTFFSVHRSPFYPGTGDQNETGQGPGLGTIFNLPLPFGVSRREYRERFHTVLEQVAIRCQPELVLISAGFDAHELDPVGSLGLQSEDFHDLTQLVVAVAEQYCGGRIVSLLEGGYNVDALAESVACHLESLLSDDPSASVDSSLREN
jgi:acetoin utilization deacetylase AcuC-like enzyme